MSAEQGFNSKPIQASVSILGLIVLLVWMQGGFTSKTPPGTAQAAEDRTPPRGPTAQAEILEIDEVMVWPGLVSARSVMQVASKVPARVLEIAVRAGDAVKKGQVLVRLDERELQSRLGQARSMLAATQAEAARAGTDAQRMRNLFEREAATQQSLEAAQAAAKSSEARVREAQATVAAAASVLTETVLRAPFDGTVVRRDREPGDMAMPGASVLTLQSGQKLRVEAAIPERCAGHLVLGSRLKARIGAKDYAVELEEIAPAADPSSHTVLVKAGLETQGGAQPGAFAWLEQSCGRHRALAIPESAVVRSGQLASVHLVASGKTMLRHVRTGKTHDGKVEILSGLKEGDAVLLGGGQ
jgi:RND family efflux transporter MFP subunit